MQISPLRTHALTNKDSGLTGLLDKYLPSFEERSILIITSKIISILEGRVVKIGDREKADLVSEEADLILQDAQSQYGITLTVKNGVLIPTAGIDESNGDGYYILWPKNAQETADTIREYLCKRFGIKNAGVLITDSTTAPLRWGTRGIAVAHSGFKALSDYIGKKDLFGRKITVTKASITDGLAAAGVLVMGEGAEQTPLAVAKELPFVTFQDCNPTKEELAELEISIEEDLYAPILTKGRWKKTGKA